MPDGRSKQIVRVLWLTLILNWLVSAGKITVGIVADNLTVVADGLHSALDGANNIIGIVAVSLAARPPDEKHPYGHRKFENIAAMAVGGMLVLMCWEILENVGGRVIGHLRGTAPEAGETPELWYLAIVGASIGVNLLVAWYERRAGDRLGSSFLKADASHTMSDAFVTGLSLASLLSMPIAWWIDPILAIGVLAFLIYAAWGIITENLGVFADEQRLDPEAIREVAEGVAGVMATDQIRSHGASNDIHLDLHIIVDRDMTAGATEEVEQAVRRALRERFEGLTLISIEHRTPEHQEEG